MRRYGLSKKPKQDAHLWWTVGVSFFKKWSGDPRRFLTDCRWDALTVLDRLRTDTHLQRNRAVLDFPFLRGPKIGPLWLRMLRENVGIADLKRMEEVPIPVDVHIARSTLCLGVVKGPVGRGQSGIRCPTRVHIPSSATVYRITSGIQRSNGSTSSNAPPARIHSDSPASHSSTPWTRRSRIAARRDERGNFADQATLMPAPPPRPAPSTADPLEIAEIAVGPDPPPTAPGSPVV
jgi:hypothetical protein